MIARDGCYTRGGVKKTMIIGMKGTLVAGRQWAPNPYFGVGEDFQEVTLI